MDGFEVRFVVVFGDVCLGLENDTLLVSVYNEVYSSSHIAAILSFPMQVFQRGINSSRLGSLGPNETGPTKGTHHQ